MRHFLSVCLLSLFCLGPLGCESHHRRRPDRRVDRYERYDHDRYHRHDHYHRDRDGYYTRGRYRDRDWHARRDPYRGRDYRVRRDRDGSDRDWTARPASGRLRGDRDR